MKKVTNRQLLDKLVFVRNQLKAVDEDINFEGKAVIDSRDCDDIELLLNALKAFQKMFDDEPLHKSVQSTFNEFELKDFDEKIKQAEDIINKYNK